MRRRTAILAGWAAAAAASALVVVLSVAQAGDVERYRDATRGQRRATGRAVAAPVVAAPAGPRMLCVRGAGGFASAAAAALGRGARTGEGKLDPVGLRLVSSAAVEAERWAELAAAGPAVPQRMGLDYHGAPMAPPSLTCEGAPAFALARVSAPGAPAAGAAEPPDDGTADARPATTSKRKPRRRATGR